MDATLAALLICPACGDDFAYGAAATCGACGRTYSFDDGILSLTSEGAYTALDEIDYDAVYRVDAEASQAFARSCLDLLGDRLPSSIDSFLEIGAGTGQFTLGFLTQVPTRTAVVTDISPSMLRICRRRLAENGIAEQATRFVTWDGARCLRTGAFQLIAGFSVLHHVLDFQGMLGALSEALREDGVALFLEPNYRFHVAMIDTVCEIFVAVLDDPQWTAEDRLSLSNWLFENNTNLRFRGDDAVLAGREDKHLFDGGQMAAAASAAGFDRVELVPFGGPSECYVALKVYSNQIGLRDPARDDLLARFSRLLPGHFAHLADEDLAPSTLIVLHRGGADRAPQVRRLPEPLRGEVPPRFAYDVALTLGRDGEAWTVALQGWVLGDTDVSYIEVELDSVVERFPVQMMRADVNSAFNSRRIHPLRRALFCGIAGAAPRRLGSGPPAGPARLTASAADGERYVLGEVSLGHEPATVSVTRIDPA